MGGRREKDALFLLAIKTQPKDDKHARFTIKRFWERLEAYGP